MPGCSRTGLGFWPYDPRECPECAGLTEDVAHTKQALARGYAILVLTAGGKSFCWGAETDAAFLKTAIPSFLRDQPILRHKPVFVMGASSGGGLMLRSLNSLGVRVDGVIALVATKQEVSAFDLPEKLPPIVWITMSEPGEVAAAKQRVAAYARRGGAAAMAVAPAHKVTDEYFANRHPLISREQSAQMARVLKSMGVIGADGTIRQDPKERRAWLSRMSTTLPFLKNNKHFQPAPFHKASLLQAMLVAWSKHDHVCDYLTAALAWLETGGKANFDDLARRYRVVKPAALMATRYPDGTEPAPSEAFAFGHGPAPSRGVTHPVPVPFSPRGPFRPAPAAP